MVRVIHVDQCSNLRCVEFYILYSYFFNIFFVFIFIFIADLQIFLSLSFSKKQQQHSGGKGKNGGHSSAHQSKGAAQQTMDDDGVPYQYTMYDDVANNPTVVQMLVSTRQAIHLTHQKCKKYLDSWKKYDRQFGLWDTSKMKIVQNCLKMARILVEIDIWAPPPKIIEKPLDVILWTFP